MLDFNVAIWAVRSDCFLWDYCFKLVSYASSFLICSSWYADESSPLLWVGARWASSFSESALEAAILSSSSFNSAFLSSTYFSMSARIRFHFALSSFIASNYSSRAKKISNKVKTYISFLLQLFWLILFVYLFLQRVKFWGLQDH